MNEKITEKEMLKRLKIGSVLLDPLIISSVEFEENRYGRQPDALIAVTLPEDGSRFNFVLESKTRATLEAVHTAVGQAKGALRENEWPLIQVPFLPKDRLEYLERERVSGIDLCGNGVVVIPNRLLIVRSGQPNTYPDSRPLNNPYGGRSAIVARVLLSEPLWPSLKTLLHAIQKEGAKLSMSQASKAIRAYEEDLIVGKQDGTIRLQDPMRLLDKLGFEWVKPRIRSRIAFRLSDDVKNWANRLSANSELRWAMTGESSASRYVVFAQGGPRRIAVSDLPLAASLIGGVPESIPNYADVELFETEESGFYFKVETDEMGMRWASRLQTWLELQGGDARQKEAADDLRRQILREVKQ